MDLTRDMAMAELARRELFKRGVVTKDKQPDSVKPVSAVDAIFNVPGAAVRSAIQGTGYTHGALNPDKVPRFQDQALHAYYNSSTLKDNPTLKTGLGNIVSAAGLTADIATNPADVLSILAGELPIVKQATTAIADTKAGKAVDKVANYPIEKLFGMIPKKATQASMSVLTGDATASKNFINNPEKYNLNPMSEVPSSSKELELGKQRINILTEDLKTSSEDLRIDSVNRINDMKDGFTETRTALKNGNIELIQNLSKKSEIALKNIEDASNKELLTAYDGALNLMNEAKSTSGKAVEASLKDIMKSGKTTLPYRNVMEPFKSTLDEFTASAKLPFKIKIEAEGPKIIGKTSITDPEDVQIFSNLFQEMNNRIQSGFEISDLQTLKGQLQEVATHYFDTGKGNLGTFYKELSQKLNPVNIITSNPELSSKLPNLAKANSAYHELLPKFDDATSFFSKKTPSGEFIPDFSKVIKAVENNDISTLRQIEKAESILPQEARLLPKVKASVQSIDDSRRSAIEEMSKTKQLLDEKLMETRQAQAETLRETRGSDRQEKLDLLRLHRDQVKLEQRKLSSHIDFLKEQETLRNPRIVGLIPSSSIVGETYKAGSKVSKAVMTPSNNAIEALTSILKQNPRLLNVAGSQLVGQGRRRNQLSDEG